MQLERHKGRPSNHRNQSPQGKFASFYTRHTHPFIDFLRTLKFQFHHLIFGFYLIRKGIKGDLSRSCNRLLMFSRLNWYEKQMTQSYNVLCVQVLFWQNQLPFRCSTNYWWHTVHLLLRPTLYCAHSVDITHQVSLVVYMKQFWLFRLLSVSLIFFFVSLLAQSFMMLHFCQKKEQNLGVTSVYSLLGLVRTRTLQYLTHFCFPIFVEQFALTICVGSKRILVGLAVNWPKF